MSPPASAGHCRPVSLNPRATVELGGVLIDNVSMSEAVEAIDRMISEKACGYVVTPNVDHIVRFRKDSEFRKATANAALVLADGMPLVWSSRFLGTPLREKVSGSDLFPRVCDLAARKGHRLFFLGGRPGAARQASERLRRTCPSIQIVGYYSPPYGFESDPDENHRILDMIRGARPDVLFVGLGSPKQEKWMWRHGRDCRVPVAIGIGVTFEFAAGMVKRAPLWMQRAGLEWLWRLAMEPRRLWRRYLLEDPKFFWYVAQQKWPVMTLRRPNRSGMSDC